MGLESVHIHAGKSEIKHANKAQIARYLMLIGLNLPL
jgi:hypothetical protein